MTRVVPSFIVETTYTSDFVSHLDFLSLKFGTELSTKHEFTFPDSFFVDEAIVEASFRFNRFSDMAGLKHNIQLSLDRLSAIGS